MINQKMFPIGPSNYGDFFSNKLTSTLPHEMSRSMSEVVNNIKDDGLISYRINSSDFRCDELVTDHDGLHVLFTGCSETFGTGIQAEDSWARLVYDRLSKDVKLSGYFNIAKEGSGYDIILSDLSKYIIHSGVPDYIFMLMPTTHRLHQWVPDSDSWSDLGVANHPIYVNRKEPVLINKESTLQNFDIRLYSSNLFNIYVEMKILETLFNKLGTKLIWSTWSKEDAIAIERFSHFTNYISLTNDLEDLLYKDSQTFLSTRGRDGVHSGKWVHNYWYEKFYNKLLELK